MCYANNKKWKKTYNGRNIITKSRKIRTHEKKETYKYLGILEADTIKQENMREKMFKYLRRTRKQLETKLYGRNFIKRIYTWPVPLVRYSSHC